MIVIREGFLNGAHASHLFGCDCSWIIDAADGDIAPGILHIPT